MIGCFICCLVVSLLIALWFCVLSELVWFNNLLVTFVFVCLICVFIDFVCCFVCWCVTFGGIYIWRFCFTVDCFVVIDLGLRFVVVVACCLRCLFVCLWVYLFTSLIDLL